MSALNWQSTTDKTLVRPDLGINGKIIYQFNIGNYIYIGQTDRGTKRFQEHFGNSYYYFCGQPPRDLTTGNPQHLYEVLGTAPWNQVSIRYEEGPYFGLTYESLDDFRRYFRFKGDMNIPTNQLADYTILNYAEILHIYRATKSGKTLLNIQMGSKSDQGLYSIRIDDNGNIIPQTLILTQSSSPDAAARLFMDKDNLLTMLQDFVNNYVNSHIQDIYNASFIQQKNGITISLEQFEKELNKAIQTNLKPQLGKIKEVLHLDFAPQLKMSIAEGFSRRTSLKEQFLESYKKSLQAKSSKTFKSLESLFKALEHHVSFSFLTIEDVFTSETISKITKQTKGKIIDKIGYLKHEVPRELFKYEAYLRFNNIFLHERESVDPVWVQHYATRKYDNRKRHQNEEDKRPYIEFTRNSNYMELKENIKRVYDQAHFYYGKDWDSYYGHFMALVGGKHDVAYLGLLPLEQRIHRNYGEKMGTRKRYAVYIHTDLSWQDPVNLQVWDEMADKVWPAYITPAGEDNWIKAMLSATLDNITDY